MLTCGIRSTNGLKTVLRIYDCEIDLIRGIRLKDGTMLLFDILLEMFSLKMFDFLCKAIGLEFSKWFSEGHSTHRMSLSLLIGQISIKLRRTVTSECLHFLSPFLSFGLSIKLSWGDFQLCNEFYTTPSSIYQWIAQAICLVFVREIFVIKSSTLFTRVRGRVWFPVRFCWWRISIEQFSRRSTRSILIKNSCDPMLSVSERIDNDTSIADTSSRLHWTSLLFKAFARYVVLLHQCYSAKSIQHC